MCYSGTRKNNVNQHIYIYTQFAITQNDKKTITQYETKLQKFLKHTIKIKIQKKTG